MKTGWWQAPVTNKLHKNLLLTDVCHQPLHSFFISYMLSSAFLPLTGRHLDIKLLIQTTVTLYSDLCIGIEITGDWRVCNVYIISATEKKNQFWVYLINSLTVCKSPDNDSQNRSHSTVSDAGARMKRCISWQTSSSNYCDEFTKNVTHNSELLEYMYFIVGFSNYPNVHLYHL